MSEDNYATVDIEEIREVAGVPEDATIEWLELEPDELEIGWSVEE